MVLGGAMRRSAGMIGVLAALCSGWAAAQPLSVLYGPEAPSREGDVDHAEQILLQRPRRPGRAALPPRSRPRGGRRARHAVRRRRGQRHPLSPGRRPGRVQRRPAARRSRRRLRGDRGAPLRRRPGHRRALGADRRLHGSRRRGDRRAGVLPRRGDRRDRGRRQRLRGRRQHVVRPRRPAARLADVRLSPDRALAQGRGPDRAALLRAGRHAADLAELRRRRGGDRPRLDLR